MAADGAHPPALSTLSRGGEVCAYSYEAFYQNLLYTVPIERERPITPPPQKKVVIDPGT